MSSTCSELGSLVVWVGDEAGSVVDLDVFNQTADLLSVGSRVLKFAIEKPSK